MKAIFRKLNANIEKAIHVRKEVRDYFSDTWHYHEMLEFVVILKGQGKRSIGDSIEDFSNGDVILVGKKLPHVWRSSIVNDESQSQKECCSSIIIQFQSEFIGEKFIELSESVKIKKLFKNAEMGISFQNETRKKIFQKIKKLTKLKGMDRLLLFLKILDIASKSTDHKILASPLFKETILNSDKKINKVFEFVMDNFSNPITLDEVSDIVSMNKTSFCRYFKRRTKKTFTHFLNEIRIGHACNLLTEGSYSISESAYLSGYNSPSHFNKQFHTIKKISPSEFSKNLKEL